MPSFGVTRACHISRPANLSVPDEPSTPGATQQDHFVYAENSRVTFLGRPRTPSLPHYDVPSIASWQPNAPEYSIRPSDIALVHDAHSFGLFAEPESVSDLHSSRALWSSNQIFPWAEGSPPRSFLDHPNPVLRPNDHSHAAADIDGPSFDDDFANGLPRAFAPVNFRTATESPAMQPAESQPATYESAGASPYVTIVAGKFKCRVPGCSKQDRGFRRAEHLRRHERQHTAPMMTCVFCPKKLKKRYDNYKAHIKLHTLLPTKGRRTAYVPEAQAFYDSLRGRKMH